MITSFFLKKFFKKFKKNYFRVEYYLIVFIFVYKSKVNM